MWRIIWPATPKCNGLIKQDTLIGSIYTVFLICINSFADIKNDIYKWATCVRWSIILTQIALPIACSWFSS